jgi:hypothetical protein
MIRIPLMLASIALLAAPPAFAASHAAERGEAKLAKILENRVAGKPVSCLYLRNVRSSQIMNGTAIVYESGGTLYVNRPDGAGSLDDDDILMTRTSTSQLCRLDSVNLFSRAGRYERGFVTLGNFVPYTKAPK